MKYSTVLFISNDFGFGPLSRTHTIARALKNVKPELSIKIVTSGRNDYLLNDDDIELCVVNDLRSVDTLTEYLTRYNATDTFVISTMNRFALTAAKQCNFTTVL